MRYYIKLITSLSTFCIIYKTSLAQNLEAKVNQIDSYRKLIDSLTTNKSDSFVEFIEEGGITKQTTTTEINGHSGNIDTIRSKVTGGWSRTFYLNQKQDSVFKIEYHDNIEKNFYLEFYYKENSLVLMKVEYQGNGIGKLIFRRTKYYEGKQLLTVAEQGKLTTGNMKDRVNLNWEQDAVKYLAEGLGRK